MPDQQPKQRTKYWGDADKAILTTLVSRGDVDINDTTLENIEAVRQLHFPHRDKRLFRNNFKNFQSAWSVEQEKAG